MWKNYDILICNEDSNLFHFLVGDLNKNERRKYWY